MNYRNGTVSQCYGVMAWSLRRRGASLPRPLRRRGESLPQPLRRRGETPPGLPEGEEWLAHCPTGNDGAAAPLPSRGGGWGGVSNFIGGGVSNLIIPSYV